jgi:hypothetical protein
MSSSWTPGGIPLLKAKPRTHRIGQRNKVIAYRLIAKDTVEEILGHRLVLPDIILPLILEPTAFGSKPRA